VGFHEVTIRRPDVYSAAILVRNEQATINLRQRDARGLPQVTGAHSGSIAPPTDPAIRFESNQRVSCPVYDENTPVAGHAEIPNRGQDGVSGFSFDTEYLLKRETNPGVSNDSVGGQARVPIRSLGQCLA